MDHLRRIAGKLYDLLPSCHLCLSTIYESRIYVVFSCLHFLCYECAARDPTSVCEMCKVSDVIYVDYMEVERIRTGLVQEMKELAGGNPAPFPAAMEMYYSLISLLVESQHRFEPSACTQPAQKQSAPTLAKPTFIPSILCKCGRTKLITDNCVCVSRLQTCDVCFAMPCRCVSDQRETWQCPSCRFELNWKYDDRCARCHEKQVGNAGSEGEGQNGQQGSAGKRGRL